jgi:hypothetical protein
VTGSPTAAARRALIIALADRYRLPAVYAQRYYVTRGGCRTPLGRVSPGACRKRLHRGPELDDRVPTGPTANMTDCRRAADLARSQVAVIAVGGGGVRATGRVRWRSAIRRLGLRSATSAIAGRRKRRVRIAPQAQAIFLRRRHQPRRPPPAKIRPGSPAPAMGPGTLEIL